MEQLKDKLPKGFDSPIILPEGSLSSEWQKNNKEWWENHPMRYDWNDKLGKEEFSKEFYEEIDKRFFQSAEEFMPSRNLPFDAVIDFDTLSRQNVLEIGVGNGSHAALLSQYAAHFTGIDLTQYAVRSTTKRLQCFGLNGRIMQMDAENMNFEKDSFDFVWSWGVIHHSSNTRKVLEEIRRVLKPGGKATLMIYHRNFWNYYVMGAFFRGILQGYLFKKKSLHEIMQLNTDGALARYYTKREWNALVEDLFIINKNLIFGIKGEIFPLPASALKNYIMSCIPNAMSRFANNTLQAGSFLVTFLEKPCK